MGFALINKSFNKIHSGLTGILNVMILTRDMTAEHVGWDWSVVNHFLIRMRPGVKNKVDEKQDNNIS